MKPWSLLAYTVADDKGNGDPLDAACKHELNAMCDAADLGALSIAVQVDFKFTPGVYRATVTSHTDPGPAKPRAARAGFEEIALHSPLWRHIASQIEQSTLRVERERVDLNAATRPVLHDFLRFGVEACPADRYLLFMYGHASGPMGMFYDRASASRVPNTMRLNDVSKAIAGLGDRAAIVLFRDCYMNTIETAYELRRSVPYIIASQSEMPIAGIWPWAGMLTALMPGAPPLSIARAIAMQLGQFMDERKHREPFAEVPVSLVDTAASVKVTAPLRALATALDDARGDATRRKHCAAAVDAARIGHPNTPRAPGDPALVDVPTLCEGLQRVGWDAVSGPARALADVVKHHVVLWHHAQLDRFHGISLYCKPTTARDIELSILQSGDEDEAKRDAAAYRTLSLCRDTGWERIALNPLVG